MADTANIDFSFVGAQETNNPTLVDVPNCTAKSIVNKKSKVCFGKPLHTVIGSSGVTFAYGFDVGGLTAQQLQNLNLPAGLQNKIKPFVGLKKKAAYDALLEYEKKNGKLTLSATEISQLTPKVFKKQLNSLMHYFNLTSKVKFQDLAGDAQTAIFSFAYQYGSCFGKSKSTFAQKYWQAVTTQDWKTAKDLLNNAPEYADRRRQELKKLEAAFPS